MRYGMEFWILAENISILFWKLLVPDHGID